MLKRKLPPLTKAGLVKRRLLWLCMFLCIGGASLVCIGGKTCLKAWQARDWQAVPCVIDHSGINSAGKPGHELTYTIYVTYHYSFNGQDYHSDQANFDPEGAMDLKTVGALSNRFPDNAHVTCYVNPQQPTEAVLDRTVSHRNLLATIGGVGLMLASFAGLIVSKRKK